MRRELPFSIPLTTSVCIAHAIDLKIAMLLAIYGKYYDDWSYG